MSETKIVKLLNYMAKFLLIDRIKVVLKSVDNPVKVPAPTEFKGIPILDNRKSFFAGVDEIWDLFNHAMKSAEIARDGSF